MVCPHGQRWSGIVLFALCGAVSIQAATNTLDETAGRLVDIEKRSAIPKEGMVAERPTKGGRVYYVPGGRIERSELNRPTPAGTGR
jgi:hypothetical protein